MVTEAEVRSRLERLVASATPPTLGADEISALLAGAALADSSGATPVGAWLADVFYAETEWTANMALAVDARVVPSVRTGRIYKVTASDGAAGATEPAWPTYGSVILDGITYTLDAADPAAWQPTYALAAAAAEGWRMKAGLVSDRFRFADDGDSYDRQQIFEHSFRMAEQYERKAAAGELIVGTPAGGSSGASMLSLDPSDRRVVLDEDRLVGLRQWGGSGPIPRIN